MKFIIFSAIIILSQINLYSQVFPPHLEVNGWFLYSVRASSFDSTEVRTEIQDSTATHGLFSQLFPPFVVLRIVPLSPTVYPVFESVK